MLLIAGHTKWGFPVPCLMCRLDVPPFQGPSSQQQWVPPYAKMNCKYKACLAYIRECKLDEFRMSFLIKTRGEKAQKYKKEEIR